jgi:hypothetical protein
MTPKRPAVSVAMLIVASVVAAAQIVNVQQPQMPPGAGAPPRDTRPAQTGTAVIRGRVFAADTGRPLRRARISVQAPELGDTRATSTNAEGRYEIKDLPAGRYNITVNRSGYLQLRYGQRRPFEAGKLLQVADKQLVDNVDFTLPRMSLITGRVFDEAGEPIAGVRVFPMRTVYFEGRRRLVPVPTGSIVTTDDAGQYRILGLPPGSYFVRAESRETWTVTEDGTERVMGYAPTYFPGTAGLTDARRVTVGIAQEASNNDFALIPGRAVTVSGVALDSQARPLAGRQVGLAQQYRSPGTFLITINAGAQTANDGTFRIANVPPGEYSLQLRTSTEVGGTTVQEAATAPIVVNDVDIDTVTLMTSAGWSAAGAITTDTGAAPNMSSQRVRVVPKPVNSDLTPAGGPGGPTDSGRVKDDWTFQTTGLYGPVRLGVTVPDGWLVKSILHDGRDVTDSPLEMRNGETLTALQIVLTNRVGSVSGQLADEKGAPLADGTIIVFSTDPDKWSEDSRFVRSARPDQDGRYQIRGLPPGEYLAVAIEYVEEGMWNDPEYLDSIRRYGQRITVGEGAEQIVALKMIAQ